MRDRIVQIKERLKEYKHWAIVGEHSFEESPALDIAFLLAELEKRDAENAGLKIHANNCAENTREMMKDASQIMGLEAKLNKMKAKLYFMTVGRDANLTDVNRLEAKLAELEAKFVSAAANANLYKAKLARKTEQCGIYEAAIKSWVAWENGDRQINYAQCLRQAEQTLTKARAIDNEHKEN